MVELSLVQVRAFVTVAEELHFGRAARRLHVTQPALSQQISKLERQLGVTLLERTSRSVALTAAGVDVLPDARRVLQATQATWQTARGHGTRQADQLAIGFTGSAAGRLLPRVLERYREQRPTSDVSLRELTEQRYDLLRDGQLDVIFGRLQPGEMPDLDVFILERVARMVVLREDHPLATRRFVKLRELAGEGFITQPERLNPAHRQRWTAEQHAHGLPGRISAEASSVQEFLNLAAAGAGVCLVPAEASEFNPWPGHRLRARRGHRADHHFPCHHTSARPQRRTVRGGGPRDCLDGGGLPEQVPVEIDGVRVLQHEALVGGQHSGGFVGTRDLGPGPPAPARRPPPRA